MQKTTIRRKPLVEGIALALGATVVMPALAQEAAPVALEEVVVTGIRASLEASMDLKRNATGVVDAITAEDMGDFPDTNLAESLQRITGVSIDRERGEGARVTVRGFGPNFNLVLLNGRQMPTAGAPAGLQGGTGRSFDFGNLASEGISAVEIYKSGRADVPTGGIGATMNIRTTRPLDAPGFKATAAASAMYDDSRTKLSSTDWTPEFSGLISNTFLDDRVGVALSLVRQERKSGGATASVGGWRTFQGPVDNCWCTANPSEWGGIPPAGDPNQQNRPGEGDIYSVPQSIGYELADYDRVRTNGQLTFQFRPVESVTATLDYTYSELELDRNYNNLSAWFNFGAQETLWTDGPNATPLVYTENLGGSDFSMGAGTDAIQQENKSLGFNVGWQATDRLFLELDYHDSSAEGNPNSKWGSSALLSTAAYTRDRTTGYFGKEFPVLELGLSNPLTPDDMRVTGSVFTNDFSKMDINQGRLSGNLEFDTSFVRSVDFGFQYTEVDNRSAGSVTQRDSWYATTPLGALADLMTPANLGSSFDQIPGAKDPRQQTDFFTFDMADVIERMESLLASGDAIFQGASSGDNGPCGTALCPTDNVQYDRRTNEETKAVYVQLNMATEWGSMPVDMRLGLRYEETDVLSRALAPNYTKLVWTGGNEVALISDGQTFTQGKGSYDYLLPNFDFSIDLTEGLKARASLSRTLARPGYVDIQGGLSLASPVRITGGTGSRGNPALKPYLSDNLDLSLEWYYGNGSYVAAGYFYKEVENFIGTGNVTENAGNLPHPALGPLGDQARAATGASDGGTLLTWICQNLQGEEGVSAGPPCTVTGIAGRDPVSPFDITIPVNIEKATVDGWEFVLQHNFWDTGFGVILNATIVDADVGYDNLLCPQPNCNLSNQFVITGLSDSANAILFYEKYGFGIRLAYNWRDKFLAGTGQNNVGAGPPTYVDEYGQWDLNASYEFNEHLIVFTDIINLTNETAYVYGRDSKQALFATQLGTRYNLGVRYKF